MSKHYKIVICKNTYRYKEQVNNATCFSLSSCISRSRSKLRLSPVQRCQNRSQIHRRRSQLNVRMWRPQAAAAEVEAWAWASCRNSSALWTTSTAKIKCTSLLLHRRQHVAIWQRLRHRQQHRMYPLRLRRRHLLANLGQRAAMQAPGNTDSGPSSGALPKSDVRRNTTDATSAIPATRAFKLSSSRMSNTPVRWL